MPAYIRTRLYLINYLLTLFLCAACAATQAQSIGDFISVDPLAPNYRFAIPTSHVFQQIIAEGDALTAGGKLPERNDFTCYVPIDGSSEQGYISINSESSPGGVTVLDVHYDQETKLWQVDASEAVDFDPVGGTTNNCSGALTPWNTVVSCEELTSIYDNNLDGYVDFGWCVELDPATKQVKDKLWALGNFQHENIVVHPNRRTVYLGADSGPGYLFKFVADEAEDLSSGALYVYRGSKQGSGQWVRLKNLSYEDRNSTLAQCADWDATVFIGVEDVEIGPEGLVYLAVKDEHSVYRFRDSDPLTGTTVPMMETYVGNTSYTITHTSGTTVVDWGTGNDNLAFDQDNNLWICQDGDNNYIWVVGAAHSQENPDVRIFGRTPKGAEPTGITFTPDYKFLFISIQHPDTDNEARQIDAAGNEVNFDRSTSLAVSLRGNLGDSTNSNINTVIDNPIRIILNPNDGNFDIRLAEAYADVEVHIFSADGKLILSHRVEQMSSEDLVMDLSAYLSGLYFVQVYTEGFLMGTARMCLY